MRDLCAAGLGVQGLGPIYIYYQSKGEIRAAIIPHGLYPQPLKPALKQ